jgi:IS4 transposase
MTSIEEVKHLYKLRWTVETSFRRLKSNLNLETSHSMSLQLFEQELEARILLDTLAVIM